MDECDDDEEDGGADGTDDEEGAEAAEACAARAAVVPETSDSDRGTEFSAVFGDILGDLNTHDSEPSCCPPEFTFVVMLSAWPVTTLA